MKKIILIPAIAGLLFVAGANGQVYNEDLVADSGFDLGNQTNSTLGFTQSGGNGFIEVIPFGDHTPDTDNNLGGKTFGGFGFTSGIDVSSYSTSDIFTMEIWMYHSSVDVLGSTHTGEFVIQWFDNGTQVDSDQAFTGITSTYAQDTWHQFTETNLLKPNASVDSVSLTFRSANADGGAIFYDDFSLIAVPEPSTYAIIAGFLAFGFVAVRRRMATK